MGRAGRSMVVASVDTRANHERREKIYFKVKFELGGEVIFK